MKSTGKVGGAAARAGMYRETARKILGSQEAAVGDESAMDVADAREPLKT